MIIVGTASAAATSVAIPAHQANDLIIVTARGTTAAPTVPTAGGTVPAWTTLQSGIANAIGLSTAFFIATATTTTTGTWTNATDIGVIVLRPGVGNALSTAVARSSTGNNTNVGTVTFPALTLAVTDGSSLGVRAGTRVTPLAAFATTPPSGWTNRIAQPVAAGLVVHTRAALTVNPTADTVTFGGANAAWRAHTIEVLEAAIPTAQNVVATSLSSSQSFGVLTPWAVLALQVGSVPTASLFGTLTFSFVTRLLPGGVSSVQAFGTLTIRATVARSATGLGSAQAFGTPTIKAIISSQPSGGVSSAQAFGAAKSKIAFQVAGVSSAQAFVTPGIPTRVTVVGIGSAQQIGQPWVGQRRLSPLACIVSTGEAICGLVTSGDGHACGGLSLMEATDATTLSLASLACLASAATPICGLTTCGDGSICGGLSLIDTLDESERVLQPLGVL